MIAIIAEGSKDRASMILNFKLSSIDVQIGTVWDKSSVMNLKIDSLFSSVKMLNDSTLMRFNNGKVLSISAGGCVWRWLSCGYEDAARSMRCG